MRAAESPEAPSAAFSLAQSTYRGTVADLMRPGAAKPFRQPWYTSIPCTPSDTGMPMGGIGSAFTLTPAGTTPCFSLLNGFHVTPGPGESLRLRSLYFAERAAGACLKVVDPYGLLDIYANQPLVRPDGRRWLDGQESPERIQEAVSEMAADPTLYRDNEAGLRRWRVALSSRTRSLLAEGDMRNLSRFLLLDVFGATLTLENRFEGSLTGDVDERVLAGQPAYPASQMQHAGLYPVCATEYVSGRHALRVKVVGFSPIIRSDESACSMPVMLTDVEFDNPTPEPLEASLVWTMENFCGDQVVKARPESQDSWFNQVKTANHQMGEVFGDLDGGDGEAAGLRLFQSPGALAGDFDGTIVLAVEPTRSEPRVFASVHPSFSVFKEKDVVAQGLRTGCVSPWHLDFMLSGRERKMGAICATLVIPPGGSKRISFALVLDFPGIRLNGFSAEKKYTCFFPDSDGRAVAMAREALAKRESFLARIAEDHASLDGPSGPAEILRSAPSVPAANRFKTLLCNQLAFISESTVWDTEDHFWIRECADYPFFNSLDVYFYGSFALMWLLPRLDGCILKEFGKAVLAEDPSIRRYWRFAYHPYADLSDPRFEGPRSVVGAVPHDMGSPFDPRPDAYTWHNVKHWKDLAPKFLLMVWRHYVLTGDKTFLFDCWAPVGSALGYLSAMRNSGESIPRTHGTDDTFDNLTSHGISIYCGSLWVAALAAGAAIAGELGEDIGGEWRELGARARRDLVEALWDEDNGYYRFYRDLDAGRVCDHVFSDQMLSDVWLDLLGLEELTPKQRRRRIAKAVLERNFRAHSPWLGAANLCGKDGTALEMFQGQEVWVGVQYCLAAACLRAGDSDGAWELIETQYRNLYEMARIPFGAPEGFNGSVRLDARSFGEGLGVSADAASAWLDVLERAGILDSSRRISKAAFMDREAFLESLSGLDDGLAGNSSILAGKVQDFLRSHALQYTAGRYLRPGMAWVFAWKFPAAR